MKKKSSKLGFTLIELLAAIIIIIVVIAITVPLVINMIEIVKREAFRATAYSIADSGRLLVANENESQGYQEFYYLDGKEYNADGRKLDYSGKGPKTGTVVINEKNKVVLAIHNGTYCATKSANTNKVTVTKTAPDDCNAYSIIETCDTWEQIAIKYDVNLNKLLAANDETDVNSSTCGREIKIPVSPNSSGGSYAGDGGTTVYYKTYYTVGYVSSSATLPLSYEYTIKLGVLPLNIADIKVTRVTEQSVFETLDDFKRYITKKNMGEVIWPGEEPAAIDISQASVFRDHAARTSNMSADDVVVQCDTTTCYATVSATVDNLTNVNLNTIEGVGQVAYTPIKFTVEFNGEPDTCAVMTSMDAVPGTLAGTGTNIDPYLVESIEDLVALSNSVNAGSTYSGKYISLKNSFDFNNQRSYKDYNTTAFGDINGNGTVEGLLTELTTGAGFVPIGNSTTKFSGKLLGNTNCMFDFYINRPATSYVGLIGYTSGGSISALTMKGVNITGGDYTGAITGYNYNSTVSASSVIGNVTGNNYVGMAVGSSYGDYATAKVTGIMIEGNVTGADNVGGIAGSNVASYGTGYLNGINKGGNITSTGANVGRIAGSTSVTNITKTVYFSGLSLPTVTVNGSKVSSTYNTGINGSTINSMNDVTKNINLAELVFDTYIGGDNDSDGYYWDYNDYGVLVQKGVSRYPLTFNLAGTGTSEDPYLINDYADLKQASMKLGSTFKLMNNIDLTNKKFYMMGSYINNFTGKFDGNLKTISNISINSPSGSYMAFTGYNIGIIQGLNLTNMNVVGAHYTAGVAGYNYNTTISDVMVTGNVTGNTYVGLAAGFSYGDYATAKVTSVIVQGNVTGSDYVGGAVGGNVASYGTNYLNAINKGGSIVSTGTNVGRIAGSTSVTNITKTVILSSLSLSSVTVNGSTLTSTYNTSINGDNIDSMADVTANVNLAELALDTYIGGDNDSNGYYWDYNDTGTVVQKRVTEYPLTFSLSGSGTAADPYLIDNYADLRQAALKSGSTFKLTSSIDLTNDRFYMLGSYVNPFTGKFDGNLQTLSNLTIDAPGGSYMGFVGYNTGTIQGLNFTNINIIGGHFVGGVVGYNYNSTVSEISVEGNVTGNTYVGLAAGYSYGDYATAKIVSIITEGNVVGSDYIGGVIGGNAASYGTAYLTGLNKGGSIVSTGTNVGRIAGSTSVTNITKTVLFSALADSSITLNGSTVSNTYNTSINGSDINSLSEVTSNINVAELALDTYIGGDTDSNGYYWDYNDTGTVVQKRVTEYPLTFSLSGSGIAENPYLVGSYTDLKQASLKLSSVYKLTSNIDLTSQRFYMLGSYVNPFSGTFDGNTNAISNLTINVPKGSYIGFSGYNTGIIKGLNFVNVDITGGNFTGAIAGYNYNNIITDATVTGDITGNNYVGLAVGYSYGYYTTTKAVSIIVEGNVVGSDYVGGIIGGNHTSYGTAYLTGINKGGSVISAGLNVGRIAGATSYSSGTKTVIFTASSLSSVTVNGSTITCLLEEQPVACTDTTSINGSDITSSDLASSSTYTNVGFNFTDEALDYIWYIDSGTAKFRTGSL